VSAPAVAVATATGLFAGTNIDDLVVLAVLNVSARAHGRPRPWQIWLGQYSGFGLLVALSLLAAAGLTVVPEGRIWLLALIPLGLGANKLIAAGRARRRGEPMPPAAPTGLVGVIGLTVANGGDNIAAYTPVFRAMDRGDAIVTVSVFVVGVAVWCGCGFWLVSHHKVGELVERSQHWIVPAVFILIAIYIVFKAG
jgi:cadmium resistance protein CadD (predicted permease)